MPHTSRRDFICTCGAGVAGLTIGGYSLLSAHQGKRPNILYIMSDDHARRAMSCYGSTVNLTPNIDRIAKEGVRFDQSFCTNSICAPSRAVILTGKYSHLNGQIDNAVTFDGSQQTVPKLLRAAGYQTALIGKWHLKSDPTGFDYWNILPGQGQYYNPDFIEVGARKRIPGYVTDLTTDFAFDWLSKRDRQQPFFLMLHHKAPHRNWMPALRHLTLYNDREYPLPETFFDDYSTRSAAAREQKMRIADDLRMASDCKVPVPLDPANETREEKSDRATLEVYLARLTETERQQWNAAYDPIIEQFRRLKPTGTELAKWKYRRYMTDYLRCVKAVDENIGRVLDYLDENQLAEDTLILYASDQGFYLGEHGWYDKRFMYEESLAFPLVVRYPATIKPYSNQTDMVLNLDLAPTFLDYAGANIPSDLQGNSLRPVLAHATPDDWRQSIYYHYYEYPADHAVRPHYGIRTHKHKLIHFYGELYAWELYDLERDPHEVRNVYDDPSYADTVRELQAELIRLRKLYRDTEDTDHAPQPPVKVEHKAVGCKVQLAYPFAQQYSGGGAGALTDGVRSSDTISASAEFRYWQGFEGVDLIATIDLGKTTSVEAINTGFLHRIESWIFLPLVVEYSLSKDGYSFKNIGNVTNTNPLQDEKVFRKSFEITFASEQIRYIRIHAKSIGVCPPWHQGNGGKAWLFADEIIVQ
ncbi:MAG: sulfatase/phosphatase domain-containing protein [bacterium]